MLQVEDQIYNGKRWDILHVFEMIFYNGDACTKESKITV